MSSQFPPPPGSVSGDFITISRWLNDPTRVQRRIRTITEQRFIADKILTGRADPSGGAILVDQNESIFQDDAVESVAPGSEFPLTDISTGPQITETVRKWGVDTLVTDEKIKREKFSPVERGLRKISNGVIRQVDAAALAKVAAQPLQTLAGADWSPDTSDVIGMIAQAIAMIRGKNQGYEADTLVIDDDRWVDMITNTVIREALPREVRDSQVQTGQAAPLLGLRQILISPNLPVAGRAFVLDSNQLGGLAEEEPLTGKSMRNEERERWRLRAKRVVTAYVQEPDAAVMITNV